MSASVDFDYAYSPRERDWTASKSLGLLRNRLDAGAARYGEMLRVFGALDESFATVATDLDPSHFEPFWNNIWLPPLDCIAICGFLATRRPKLYVEVGSGNSTKFARWIIRQRQLPTRIVSIDPYPRAEIDALCDEVIRAPLEDTNQTIFAELEPGDILFVDNSHRSFPNSDVTVFFMEILPVLPKGVVVGIHDIFLPFDYPEDWKTRFYNEQYLLAAYLFGGADGSKILLPVNYMGRVHPDVCTSPFPRLNAKGVKTTHGGAFFMER
jgi:hypothetical protein